MLNCEEVSRLLSQSMERKLPLRKRISLRLHLSMCKLCKGFARELRFLRDAARRQAADAANGKSIPNATLSNEAREGIVRALERDASDNEVS